MFIQTFPSGPLSTNAYVVACAKTGEAAIIDPAPESSIEIQKYITHKQLKLKKILLTHSHWDHIADVSRFKEQFGAPVYVHSLGCTQSEAAGLRWHSLAGSIFPVQPDVLLEDGTEVKVGNLTFRVIHTPGHSCGSVCYYEPEQHVLFSGDTLFKGSIGNVSFPTSDSDSMWISLAKLAKLPHETRVYPGHGPSTTIAKESVWLSDAKKLFDN